MTKRNCFVTDVADAIENEVKEHFEERAGRSRETGSG